MHVFARIHREEIHLKGLDRHVSRDTDSQAPQQSFKEHEAGGGAGEGSTEPCIIIMYSSLLVLMSISPSASTVTVAGLVR